MLFSAKLSFLPKKKKEIHCQRTVSLRKQKTPNKHLLRNNRPSTSCLPQNCQPTGNSPSKSRVPSSRLFPDQHNLRIPC
jgi:hypothetical protein